MNKVACAVVLSFLFSALAGFAHEGEKAGQPAVVKSEGTDGIKKEGAVVEKKMDHKKKEDKNKKKK